MDGRTGIPLVLFAAGLLILGIAWGAASQKETFVGGSETESGEVASDLTILTAFFIGVGVTLVLLAIGDAEPPRRTLMALAGGASAWLLTWLVQAAFPNYFVLPGGGSADVIQSNLLVNNVGAPSILLPVLALGILLMVLIAWATRRVQDDAKVEPSMDAIRRDHLAVSALVIPVLVVTAAGLLRVMLEYPSDMEGIGLVTILHPLGAAGCLLLAVSILLRARQVARLQHDPDQAWPVMEAWRAMDRIDIAGIAALALMAVASTFLPSEPLQITSAGPTLGFTPRSHGQSVIFLAVVLVPLNLLHRRIGDILPTARQDLEAAPGPVRRDAWILLSVVGGASVSGLVLGLTIQSTLLPWFVALLPSAIVARAVGRPRSAALVAIVAAWTMWGMGNTVVAFYDATAYPDLEFLVHPGVLAMWRMGAAALLGWVVADVLQDLAPDQPVRVVLPLSVAAAVAVALTLLLELPLNVWADTSIAGDTVAVGSLVSSQQAGVRVVMHLLAAVCMLGGSMAVTRIIRPDWFRRRPGRPVADKHGTVTPG